MSIDWIRPRRIHPLTLALTLVSAVLALASVSRGARAAQDASVRLRRFAVMAGMNDGGAGRPRLRYATSDADTMARVLTQLGGVAPSDMMLVSDATRARLIGALNDMGDKMREQTEPGVRRELVVYYSGHSDDEGLLLGSERLSYGDLRARIQAVPADVRIAILDSCASGAFTRGKGGVRRAPFLVDASSDMKGHAFLASSSANEVAQESDGIGASFFTHYLVSGLRGAADVNHDKRVTLQEAYQFAAEETLSRTERTRGGPQHAAYEFDLTGTGEFVVTDVRATSAGLVLDPNLAGRITVRDQSGALVAELRKTTGYPIELGLEPGAYVVTMDAAGAPFEAPVTLTSGQRASIGRLAFHPGKPLETAMARGGDAQPTGAQETTAEINAQASAPAAHHAHDLRATLVTVDRAAPPVTVDGLDVSLLADRVTTLSGLQLSMGLNMVDEFMRGAQLALGGNLASGPSRGVQASLGVNVADGVFRGAQLSNIVNLARAPFFGFQGSSAVNVSRAEMHGVQMAAAFNYANDLHGAQFGVVNLARQTSGAQVGVVNGASRVSGFQLGVINWARTSDGETLGVLNFIGDGIHDVVVSSSDVASASLGVKLGARHLYSYLGVAFNPGDDVTTTTTATETSRTFERGTRRWVPQAGFGWRFPIDAGVLESIDAEVVGGETRHGFEGDTNNVLSSARVIANLRVARHLCINAGLTYNVSVGWHHTDVDVALGPGQSVLHGDNGATTVRLYPGFVLGLRI